MPASALDAAQDVLTRAHALLELDSPELQEGVREDLRRTALAFGVAALDTYMHWTIRKVSFAKPLPKGLAKLEIPFGTLLEIANSSVEARKHGTKDRPQVRARNALKEKLLKMTFQSSRDIELAWTMLGVQSGWKTLAKTIEPPATPEELKKRLDHFCRRRNAIVHEGDLKRLDRPQSVQRVPIDSSEVAEGLSWIEAFIVALAKVHP